MATEDDPAHRLSMMLLKLENRIFELNARCAVYGMLSETLICVHCESHPDDLARIIESVRLQCANARLVVNHGTADAETQADESAEFRLRMNMTLESIASRLREVAHGRTRNG